MQSVQQQTRKTFTHDDFEHILSFLADHLEEKVDKKTGKQQISFFKSNHITPNFREQLLNSFQSFPKAVKKEQKTEKPKKDFSSKFQLKNIFQDLNSKYEISENDIIQAKIENPAFKNLNNKIIYNILRKEKIKMFSSLQREVKQVDIEKVARFLKNLAISENKFILTKKFVVEKILDLENFATREFLERIFFEMKPKFITFKFVRGTEYIFIKKIDLNTVF